MTYVNLAEFFPLTWILHFVRALITFNIANAALKSKYNSFITFLSITIPCMLFSYISLCFSTAETEEIFPLLYYVIVFVVLIIVCEGKVFSKLFVTVITFAAYMFSASIASLVIDKITGGNIASGLTVTIPFYSFLFIASFVFAFSFLFAFIIRLFKAKGKKGLNYSFKYNFFMLFPLINLLSSITCILPIRYIETSFKDDFFAANKQFVIIYIAMTMTAMVLSLATIFVVDYMDNTEKKNSQLKKEAISNKLTYQEALLIDKNKKELRKVRHDLNNILLTVKSLIMVGNTDEAISLLNKTTENLSTVDGVPLCSNGALNALFSLKKTAGKKSGSSA